MKFIDIVILKTLIVMFKASKSTLTNIKQTKMYFYSENIHLS